MKKVYMSFSSDFLHYGHIELMKKAAAMGELIIGVLSDDVIACYKNHRWYHLKTDASFLKISVLLHGS